MSEYTPTEADVRGIYVEYYMRHTGRLHSHTEAEFDAWLALLLALFVIAATIIPPRGD